MLKYDSDMAVDLKEEKDFDAPFDYTEEKTEYYHMEVMKLHKDSQIYHKSKGTYVSLKFQSIDDEHQYQQVLEKLTEIISEMTSYIQLNRKKKILICGLGNSELACDRLGPLLKNYVQIQEIGYHFLLIPGVKGQTGMETLDVIRAISNINQPDLIVLVDSLATSSVKQLNSVIQISDTGLKPGSGVGNHCKALNKRTLHTPVLCIGVPTVVKMVNIIKEVLKHYNIIDENMYDEPQQIVMDKTCDVSLNRIAHLIGDALTIYINENK